MQAFPHRYTATATARDPNAVVLSSDRLPLIASAPPAEFDGPGDLWSPETLFVAAVADCYVLTFCAVAAVQKLPWTAIACQADGQVDRRDRITQFVDFNLQAQLTVPAGTDRQLATRVLLQAKHACLITHSLRAPVQLEIDVVENLRSSVSRIDPSEMNISPSA
jgi:organic hydroperoxide reductase OsmC/OhrA